MKSVDLPQGTIYYEQSGEGRPVVFVHGLLVDGGLWSPVAEELALTHRCIVPTWPLGSHTVPMNEGADLTPHGMAKLVASFLEALGLENVVLVGNDSGGAVSQLVAAYHPSRIGALVLTNCDALEAFPPRQFSYLAPLAKVPGAMWLIGQFLLRFPSLRRLRSTYGALTDRPLPQDLLHRWIEPGAKQRRVRRDAAKFMRALSPEITIAAAEALHSFCKPVLLLWAKDDRIFRLDLAHRFVGYLNDVRIEPIEGRSPFAPLDSPQAVADGIRRFAAGGKSLRVAGI